MDIVLHAEGATLAIIVVMGLLNMLLMAICAWLFGRVQTLQRRVDNVERFAENENPNLYARIRANAAKKPGRIAQLVKELALH